MSETTEETWWTRRANRSTDGFLVGYGLAMVAASIGVAVSDGAFPTVGLAIIGVLVLAAGLYVAWKAGEL